MNRTLLILATLCAALVGFSLAQEQSVTLTGSIVSEDELAPDSRVAVHIAEANNAWGLEVVSASPAAGTFSMIVDPIPADQLRPFRSGAVLLPGLQNEYRVTPDDVNYARGLVNMYVDDNGNGVFDRLNDRYYLGVAKLGSALGFFSLLYVDKAATLTGAGTTLELEPGWNVFTLRIPEGSAQYAMDTEVDDVVLDVFLP